MKDKLFLALMEASSIHAKRSRQGFMELDLSTGQPKVLYILNHMDGCLQKDLAGYCQVEPPTMTSLLNLMELKGLIRKEAVMVSGGKRAFHIILTDKGKELAAEVNKIVEDLEQIAFYGFSEAEKKSLMTMLDRVSLNLAKESLNDIQSQMQERI